MDFIQNIQKKLSSSDKKSRFPKCFMSKASRNSAAPPTTLQTSTPTNDFCDTVIMVGRPPPVVRLVLFKELGDCDRPILFDSKSFEKNEPGSAEKYRYVRSPSDWKVLSEMLFGSVGMAQKAASLKIHLTRSHVGTSIMLSRVFCLSPRESATASLDRGIENSFEMHRVISISSRRKANTMPVPLPPQSTPSRSGASSLSSQSGGFFTRSDSGISLSSMASSSYQTGPPSSYSGSLSSLAMKISSPHGRAHSLPKNKRDCFTVSSDDLAPNERLLKRTRTKIGFAVVCKPEPTDAAEFERFFFEHFPIIESHMTALKENIEKAFQLRPKLNFIELMMKALDEFSCKLHALYSSQRLPEPVWSVMTSPQLVPHHRRIVVDSFISDLSRLVSDYNTKQRNYFVSSLLTAVLTYHLGWVTSATPSQTKPNDEENEKEYNALWAQLGDLYGAVGSPTKVCRTVVTGGGHEIVSTFLSVLSYFIRSSRVDDVIPVPSQITPVSLGIQEPPSPLRVSIDMVPCDLMDSEDYVCISLLEDDEVAKEKTKAISSPSNTASPSRSPVLRTKSSPSKKPVKKEEDDEEEESSLTRSYSGPMIRGQRPRSHAFLGLSQRERTYSYNFLNKQKVVQSRRRSHDTGDVVKPSSSKLRHSFTKTSDDDISKNNSILNTNEPACVKQSEAWAGKYSNDGLQTNTNFHETDDFNNSEIRNVQSFSDIVQPPIERIVNVQRACVDVAKTDRPKTLVFAGKTSEFSDKEKSNPDSNLSDDTVPIFHDKNTKSPSLSEKLDSWKTSSKSKLGGRRLKLPQHPTKTDSQNEDSACKPPTHFQKIPSYSRIPSVDMNHNEFVSYFDDSKTTDCLPIIDDRRLDHATNSGSANSTPHVISCPNFNSLQFRASCATPDNINTKVESIYPKLSFNESDDAPSKTNDSSTKNLYPSLPVDSIVYHSGSEKVSFNRESPSTIADLPSPTVLPPRPSPSRLNSVQSTRTVTLTNEFCINEQLKELPLSDIKFSEKADFNDDLENAKAPNGFTSLMADYGQEYMNDFVLHGTPNHPEIHRKILSDLEHGCKNSTLDEPVAESVCILADTDNWSVKVYRSHRLHEDSPCLPSLNSKLVSNILNRIATMAKMKISPEFCMSQLETELRQLVLKSHVLAEYTLCTKRVTMPQLSAALNIESQDLPLLMSIASCHSPHVARMML